MAHGPLVGQGRSTKLRLQIFAFWVYKIEKMKSKGVGKCLRGESRAPLLDFFTLYRKAKYMLIYKKIWVFFTSINYELRF